MSIFSKILGGMAPLATPMEVAATELRRLFRHRVERMVETHFCSNGYSCVTS